MTFENTMQKHAITQQNRERAKKTQAAYNLENHEGNEAVGNIEHMERRKHVGQWDLFPFWYNVVYRLHFSFV